MFLPQTVAMFPSLGGVLGALSEDVAAMRDGAISWAGDMLSGALGSTGKAIMQALPDGLAAVTGQGTSQAAGDP